MGSTYDFSGWATRNNLKCGDGRTIMKDAFKEQDGQTVPLVWNHQHNESYNVLGHALLENRDSGVYAYCTFNDTESGKNARLLVEHGDVKSLSIYANKLKQQGGNVLHGAIREVSLVLAGANPGAYIDSIISHADTGEEEAVIYTDEEIELFHAEAEEKEESTEKESNKEDAEVADKTVKDVFDTLNEEQKNVVYALIGQALADKGEAPDDTDEGEEEMKHNLFENEQTTDDTLIHTGMNVILNDGKRYGSLKESFLAHADEYGITDIDWLFPDARNLEDKPGFIKRTPDEWVSIVMNGTHHTPFSRIKMMFADLREDDARAKGYIKGHLKKEEVFGLLKRVVEPTTIYKKQKLDRDDVIDITDFDVVSWLKGEMRMMLDEEISRAIVFGDGRSTLSEDKISEKNIIPIAKDADLYTIKARVVQESNETFEHAFIRSAVESQDDYEGSGNTKLFVARSTVTKMLLMEDGFGHRLYKDLNELKLALNVNQIVQVPASIIPEGIYGVIVDLNDYNVGADKGGSVNMFDDFDIDYNQMKYLIETRCSGALRKPFSAIVLADEDYVFSY